MKIFLGLWLAIIINGLAQALSISDPKEEYFVTDLGKMALVIAFLTNIEGYFAIGSLIDTTCWPFGPD